MVSGGPASVWHWLNLILWLEQDLQDLGMSRISAGPGPTTLTPPSLRRGVSTLTITPLLSFARKFRTRVLTCPPGDSSYFLRFMSSRAGREIYRESYQISPKGRDDSKGRNYLTYPSLWVERLVDVAVP